MYEVLTWVSAIYLLFGALLSSAPFVRDTIALEFHSQDASMQRRVLIARAVGHLGMLLGWPIFIRSAVAGSVWADQPGAFSAIWIALRSYAAPDTGPRLLRLMREEPADSSKIPKRDLAD